MKKIFLLIFIISMVYMQEVGSQWSDEAKAIYFQTEKISPEQALYYQLGCPIPFCNLGYAYSDNWDKGFKWDIAFIVSATIAGTIDDDDLSGTVFIASLFLPIFKTIDVYRSAEEYNDNLYKRVFNGKRPSFSMNYSDETGALFSMTIPIK